MATKLVTSLGKGRNAAKDAVQHAREKLGDVPVTLSFVYSSPVYEPREVVDTVRAETDNAHLIGASSAGEFTEREVERESVVVGLLASDDIEVFTAIAEGVKQDPESAMLKVVSKLPRKVENYPHLSVILTVDGLSGVGEEVTLLALYLLGKELKIVGGMAGDDFRMEKTFVFVDDNVCTDAVGVCLIASKMPLFTAVKHGHTPLSRALRATRARGNVLYEINNQPAWEVWKKETAEAARRRGIEVTELKTAAEIARFLTNYPLGLATEKEGEYKIRWPSGINEDGSLNFTCGIAEGAVFRVMDGSNLEAQIKAMEEAALIARHSAEEAGYHDFAGILIFDCAVRQLMLGDKFGESVASVKRVLPDVPILGWETYGEIRLEPGQFSGFHNTTSVVLLLPGVEKGDENEEE